MFKVKGLYGGHYLEVILLSDDWVQKTSSGAWNTCVPSLHSTNDIKIRKPLIKKDMEGELHIILNISSNLTLLLTRHQNLSIEAF